MITPRDFLVMLVRAELGDRIVDDCLSKDSELVEDVIDALMMWGLSTIEVLPDGPDARISVMRPNGEHVWVQYMASRTGRSMTLAEIFAEMNGHDTRMVADCAEHGPGRSVCCLAAQLKKPITPIGEAK